MTRKNKNRTANSTLAIVGALSPLDSFVVTKGSVLRTSFCAENSTFAKPQTVKKLNNKLQKK